MTPRDCYDLIHPGDEYAWANLPAEEVERWKAMHAAVIASVMLDIQDCPACDGPCQFPPIHVR